MIELVVKVLHGGKRKVGLLTQHVVLMAWCY